MEGISINKLSAYRRDLESCLGSISQYNAENGGSKSHVFESFGLSG